MLTPSILMAILAVPQVEPPPTQRVPVFGASTALIHVDALVTDKQGRQVTDLGASDFEIESGGRKFPAAVATYVPLADDAAPSRSGKLESQDVRRVIAFLSARPVIERMDGSSNIPGKMTAAPKIDRMYRGFVSDYVKPRDLVAFVNVDSAKPLLNQFTSDPKVLAVAVDALNKGWNNPGVPPIMLGPGNLEPLVRYCLEVMRLAQRLVIDLGKLPGRKLLFLVSGVLRISDDAGPGADAGFSEVAQHAKDLVELANRAGVTIYGINPGGLGTGFSDALGYLAEGTGGSTIENTDVLGPNLGKVMEQNRGYYLLGYDPGEVPGELPRRVKVRVKRQDLKVIARPQGYADSALGVGTSNDGAGRALADFLNSPLSAGAIRVQLKAFPRWTGPATAKLQAVVDIDPRSLRNVGGETSTEGGDGVTLEVVTRVVDQAGVVLKARQISLKASPADQNLRGIRFLVEAPVTRPGFYQIDVVVQDKRSGRFGNATVLAELPDLGKDKKALVASPLVMRPMDRPQALPIEVFAKGSHIGLSTVVAHATRDEKTRAARLKIQVRIRKDSVVVKELEPVELATTSPDFINVSGEVALVDLAPGDYSAEVEITDLYGHAGRNRVTLVAPLSISADPVVVLEKRLEK